MCDPRLRFAPGELFFLVGDPASLGGDNLLHKVVSRRALIRIGDVVHGVSLEPDVGGPGEGNC
jgi:hypothetical protein